MNRFVAILAAVVSLAVYAWFNPFRIEHYIGLGLFVAAVAWTKSRRMALIWTPVLLFAFAYDFLRVFDAIARHHVITDVGLLDLKLFGIHTAEGVQSPVHWLSQHTSLPADLLGGVLYSTHLAGAVILGVYFSWRVLRGSLQERILSQYLWGFLMMNLVAFVIQICVPVAPPWFDPITIDVLTTGGNAAGLLRVDAWLGIPYFENVYRHSAYVFGAMPSLHMAIPCWVAFWVRGPMKILAVVVAVLTGFFAVYLGHHFVVDVVAGALLAVVSYKSVKAFSGPMERVQAWIHALV